MFYRAPSWCRGPLLAPRTRSCDPIALYPFPCVSPLPATVPSSPPSSHHPHISSFHSMVLPRKPKPDKPVGSRNTKHRVYAEIRKNIPFNKDEVVTRTQVARKVRKRVLTKSTKVVVPIAPSAPPSPPDPLSLNHDDPQTPGKQARKGPSRSVAVRSPPLYSTQRADRARSQTLSSGSSIGMSSLMSLSNTKHFTWTMTALPPVKAVVMLMLCSVASIASRLDQLVRAAQFTSTRTTSSTGFR